jgi:hypothetical protein
MDMHVKRRSERVRLAIAISGVALALAVLANEAPVARASVGCRAPVSHPFPPVSALRASNTGCSTARAVVEYVQGWWQINGTLPGWFKAPSHGPRWHCRYQPHQVAPHPYKIARCVSGQRLVTLNLRSP